MTQLLCHCFTGVFKDVTFTKTILIHSILSAKKLSLIHSLKYWINEMGQICREGVLKIFEI